MHTCMHAVAKGFVVRELAACEHIIRNTFSWGLHVGLYIYIYKCTHII